MKFRDIVWLYRTHIAMFFLPKDMRDLLLRDLEEMQKVLGILASNPNESFTIEQISEALDDIQEPDT